MKVLSQHAKLWRKRTEVAERERRSRREHKALRCEGAYSAAVQSHVVFGGILIVIFGSNLTICLASYRKSAYGRTPDEAC